MAFREPGRQHQRGQELQYQPWSCRQQQWGRPRELCQWEEAAGEEQEGKEEEPRSWPEEQEGEEQEGEDEEEEPESWPAAAAAEAGPR